MLFPLLLYGVLKSYFPKVSLTIATACKGFLHVHYLHPEQQMSLEKTFKPQFGITLLIFFFS